MATGPKHGEEQSENKVQGSTPYLDRLEGLLRQPLHPPRPSSGGHARMACRTKQKPQRCATSITMQRPEHKLRRQCSR